MKIIGKILGSVIGLFLVWMAVTMAMGVTLIAPSATHGDEAPLVITRVWYGEIARYASAGLLAFLGVTLAVAPWRKRA